MKPDIGTAQTALDAAIGDTYCQRCGQPAGASPSPDFCCEDCQQAWHQAQSDLDGKPLDPRRLARELNRYGARPPDLRLTGGVVKGYRADSPAGLADAWARYLPPPPAAATSATTATPQVSAVAATRPVANESATDLPAVTAATPCVAMHPLHPAHLLRA